MGICSGLNDLVIGLKIFEPSRENPYCVVVNNAKPRVHYSHDWLCDFCVVGLFKMNCLIC